MPNPPLFAAQLLQEKLEEVGIPSTKAATTSLELSTKGQTSRTTLYTFESPTLRQIVKRANMKSVNLYCESMLKSISKAKDGDGSFDHGVETLKAYWEDRGVKMKGVYLEDGSGLSARNAVTTQFMVQLLRKKTKDKDFEAYFDSFPVAGQSGSMKNVLKGTKADGKLRAKSGTIKRVRSYTGYAQTSSGEIRAFSIIVNNFSGSGGALRKRMETLMLAFVR
jgi:D-alanyl-D-alanine carboxypeptidase/D-alanyl-D-alanine-endopeptidase (penicillin-binding protein 4)